MARTALTFDQKVENALNKELTDTQEDFADWLEDKTATTIDRDTLKLVQRLYVEYVNDEEVQARIQERKEANKAKAVEREAKRIEKLLKQAEALGYEIAKKPVDDSDEDSDDEDADEA